MSESNAFTCSTLNGQCNSVRSVRERALFVNAESVDGCKIRPAFCVVAARYRDWRVGIFDNANNRSSIELLVLGIRSSD